MNKKIHKFKKIIIHYRADIKKSREWHDKIAKWLKLHYPETKIVAPSNLSKDKKAAPDVIIVLGGDGTILEAARKYHKWNPLIVGFNLGRVGFLASVREESRFLKSLKLLFEKKYKADSRLMISASLLRNNKVIAELDAVNEILIQHLLGIVRLKVEIEQYPFQYINGNGVLISTASGSTALNLSAHGPIVMPNIKCFIVTELLDHNLPTPSVIVKRNNTITVTVEDYRKQNKFIITKTKKTVDVILSADGDNIIPLRKNDKILIRESKYQIRIAEMEKNYFLKSVQEKFAFH